jgi:chaperonin GroEL
LAGGVAVLYIGAATEMEMKEKKDRVDDALHATRAAVEEGIVPGGGVAYIRAIEALDPKVKGQIADEQTGMAIVRRALEEPMRTLTSNAGIDGSIVVQKIKEGKGDYGFNARTEVYENLFKAGVIDPTKVSRVALENAASIAGMLLTTEAVVADKPKKEEAAHSHGAPDMGGMGY